MPLSPEDPPNDPPAAPSASDEPNRCPAAHHGCEEAQHALAAWTRFEYALARREATAAARKNPAWSPLRLLMSLTPDE